MLTIDEMMRRYENGEDAFDLTVEKWVRIKFYLERNFSKFGLAEALQRAVLKVPFCFDYQNHCIFCPLEEICQNPSSTYYGIIEEMIESIQSGDLSLQSSILSKIDALIGEVKRIKEEWKSRAH